MHVARFPVPCQILMFIPLYWLIHGEELKGNQSKGSLGLNSFTLFLVHILVAWNNVAGRIQRITG